MTLSEFKAWFEGYTEGLETAPTKAQFDRIKEKVKEISGAPITQTVFIDRYRHYYNDVWNGGPYFGGNLSASLAVNGLGHAATAVNGAFGSNWDSHAAMYAVGKADALAA